MEPRARRAPLPVPACDELDLPRERHRLLDEQPYDPGRRTHGDAAVGHRQPACALRACPRHHRNGHDTVERRLRLRHDAGAAAEAARERARPPALDADRRRGRLPGLVHRHQQSDAEDGDRLHERPRRARVLHLSPHGELDRHGALAHSRIAHRPHRRQSEEPSERTPRSRLRPVESRVQLVESRVRRRSDQARRHRLRRRVERHRLLAGAPPHARVHVHRRPGPRRHERRALPHLRLHRPAMPQPRLHERRLRRPRLRAAAFRPAGAAVGSGRPPSCARHLPPRRLRTGQLQLRRPEGAVDRADRTRHADHVRPD